VFSYFLWAWVLLKGTWDKDSAFHICKGDERCDDFMDGLVTAGDLAKRVIVGHAFHDLVC
jgi:hypothetical protein